MDVILLILFLIHRLSLLNVDILFEIENIRISETSKTFLLSIFEAVAQAESEARSQNIKLGIKRGLEKGTSKLYDRKCYGYRYDSQGNIVINEQETKIVQMIFNLHLRIFLLKSAYHSLKMHSLFKICTHLAHHFSYIQLFNQNSIKKLSLIIIIFRLIIMKPFYFKGFHHCIKILVLIWWRRSVTFKIH